MVRHDHERIQTHCRSYLGRFVPFLMNNNTIRIQLYFLIHNFSKDALPVPRTDCNKMGSSLAVIVAG